MSEADLLAMREAMHSRGPDGAGAWIDKDRKIGLAQRRLSIIDLSDAGLQPMASADGNLQIVFNGEIYNYRHLKQDLLNRGYRFQSGSDTEVLLYLYECYGAEMLQRLRGMYAFAIWDEQKQGLFIARDPFGIKPLYIAADGQKYQFASQVKALLAGKNVDDTPEPAGHVGFHLWGHIPGPYTLYRGIREFPPGHYGWIDGQGGVRDTVCFCNIIEELSSESSVISRVDEKDYASYIQDVLEDSLEHHFISDVPVGLFLSAGIDSSVMLGSASERMRYPIKTITLAFKEYASTEQDEAPLAERVAEYFCADHQTQYLSLRDFSKHRDHLLHVMDQPTIDGVNTYFVSKVAADAGLKVALSGLGGDELFGGYPSFRQIPPLVTLFRPLLSFPTLGKSVRVLSTMLARTLTSPKYAGLFEYGGTYAGAYLLRRGLFMPWELPEVMDADLARAGWNELEPLIRYEDKADSKVSPHVRVAGLEITQYMRNQLLRDADWAGMAHSLEIRVPYVDIEVLRRLAPLMRQHAPPLKNHLGLATRKRLPDPVLQRKKTGFVVPVRDWLIETEGDAVQMRGLKGWARFVYNAFSA